MIETIEFQVIGNERMHCSGCETRIGYALRRLPGVRDVRASVATQRVSVTIDPAEIGPEQVQGRLQQLGYEVTR